MITPGDPAGIGTEVACKALMSRESRRPVVLIGDGSVIAQEAASVGLMVEHITALVGSGVRESGPVQVFEPPGDEPVEVRAIRHAVLACQRGVGAALITGPINKERLHRAGFGFAGHTDFLGHLLQAKPVMAFVGGRLRVALVTVHIPLREVVPALTVPGIQSVICTAAKAMRDHVGLESPVIAVCGVNPHAGDGGVLGREDSEIIAPAVAAARAAGVDARGPISAEAAFRGAMRSDTDLVVAMYHDQGLAPLKVVDFGRSVNWTLGLPIIRTSVDHGTAYDIAGRGVADPASMQSAIAWAERLVAQSGVQSGVPSMVPHR